MKINCLVVDDELLARRLLSDYIGKIPTLELVGSCASAIEAQTVLASKKIDLLFLDIQMPDLTGIDLLNSLAVKPTTIFTTAYTEYALKGYELSVMDYLVKPIPFDRFFQAVSRATASLLPGQQQEAPTQVNVSPENSSDEYIFVKSDYKIQKINFQEIEYIEAYGEYVLFHKQKEKIMSLGTLSKIEETLPYPMFVRVHRSFIINFSKIDFIQGYTIFINTREIPVSKSHRNELMQLISNKQLF